MVDPILTIETAYDLSLGDEAWLERLLRVVPPPVSDPVSRYAYIFDSPAPGRAVLSVLAGDKRWCQVTRELGPQVPPEFVARMYFNGHTVDSAAALAASSPVPVRLAIRQFSEAFGVGDAVGLKALEPDGGVSLSFGAREPADVTVRDERRWAPLAAHVGAGLRLRRALSRRAGAPEAVLTPGGSCVHAESAAQTRGARELLREAAKRIDRARGRLRRSHPEEAVETWLALWAGRWSLVDQFESDGRRYLVARCNEPQVRDPRALSARERQVVAFAALGHSNKLIAYTLGVSTSTVAFHLARTLRKLGLRHRVELAAALMSVPPSPK